MTTVNYRATVYIEITFQQEVLVLLPESSLPPPDSVLHQVLSLPSSIGLSPPLLCPPTDQSQPQLLLGSPLPAPAPHTEVTESLTERREPETRASTPFRARRVARPRPLSPASSLPRVPGPESDLVCAAGPTVTRLLATVVTDPDSESTAVFVLVTELVDFAAMSRLDYVASLITESDSVCPPSVEGEPALSSDVLEDMQFELECLAAALPRFASMLLCPKGDPDALAIPTLRSYAEAIAGEYSSQWQTAMDVEMAFWKSTGTYVDGLSTCLQGALCCLKLQSVTGGRILPYLLPHPKYDYSSGVVARCSTTTTLAALGFAPSCADPSLFLRTDTTLLPFYALMYVDDLVFATADTEALTLVKAELQERHTCTDLGELRSYLGLQIIRDRARRTITLTQSHMVHQVLRCCGFQYSLPQPTPLSTGHSLSAPPSDESVEPSGPYPELVGCLITSSMWLVLGGRGSVVLTGHSDVSWADDQATQRSSQGYTFSLGSGFVSWRSTRSSYVLGSSCEAEIYAGAMAAQELHWLTYLLTDFGERPRSPPVLYVDNKAMLALCGEQRLEHRTKHIALHYFLA
ncbi:unnamed protein product [Closterium sp. NIES-54]